MATDLVPGTANLADALAAVEAAYGELNAGDGADERSLRRLHQCAEELAEATARHGHRPGVIRLDEPWNLPERLRHRYVAADHGAHWIMRHCH
ncbi:hypothetical protein [Streptomyces hokutonensis]|uniref:hypothetical protein n=1 Tax=Streptomyces hokutonensis TaxID=1306990 RepID=UPI0003801B26|nr:hypothetical protein [Streptomyces hokutonensis]